MEFQPDPHWFLKKLEHYGYGYKYNFASALSDDGTIILPPNTATPTVFELKNPNQNIQGRVR